MYGDIIFLLGAVSGFVFVYIVMWVVDLMMKTNMRNTYLFHNDEDKKEIIGRLEDAKNHLEVLQKKTNDKYLRLKYNQFVDLIAFLRKRNLG